MEGDRWFELKRNGRPEFWVGYNGIKSTTWKYLYTFPLWKQDLRVNRIWCRMKVMNNLKIIRYEIYIMHFLVFSFIIGL